MLAALVCCSAFDIAVHEAPCVLFVSDCEWLCPRAGCDYEWSPGNLRAIPPTFADKELTKLFIEQVDRINRFDYAVTGPWAQPDVVQLDTGGTLSKILKPFSGGGDAATPGVLDAADGGRHLVAELGAELGPAGLAHAAAPMHPAHPLVGKG